MLGKLLKHDLRSTFRLFPILFIGAAGLFGMGMLSRLLDIIQLQITFTVFLVILAIFALVAPQIILAVRFYKGMFSEQGYLTQTLPVSSGNLIFSKLISAVLMMLSCVILAVLAVFGIILMYDISFDIFKIFDEILGSTSVTLLIFYCVTFLISFFLFAAEVYCAIALAHTRQLIKNSGIMSVLMYFAINTALSVVDALAMLFIPLGMKITDQGVSWVTTGSFSMILGAGNITVESTEFTLGVGSWITQIAAVVGLLVLTNWLIKNKTSVK